MYNLGDSTYLAQPKKMSDKLVEQIFKKVMDHCLRHDIKYFEFIFHGGEPLLLKREFYEEFISRANELFMPAINLTFSLQTNGILLNKEWCKMLGKLNVNLGISLDGTPEVNNKSRVDHQGKGSYKATISGLEIANNDSFFKNHLTILCVIDVLSDPIEVYEHFKSLSIKKINFLFPHATYDFPPPHLGNRIETNYADWLIAIFDEWFEDDSPKPMVRLFHQVIELIIGIDRGFDYLGKRNLEFLVIETDGSIEATGALKVCGNGFTKEGKNILNNTIEEALNTPLARQYQLSHKHLPQKCVECPIVNVCGGGFLPHRFSNERGFDNPSIYCKDLMKLITHIQNKIFYYLPSNLRGKKKIERVIYEEIKDWS